ncbi:MAG TPA: isochorismatase family protein [Thermoleophilaceae bacterium]|jgi:nicotinamidase-related amidase|nr:isochorismatase family protein [Thermoleophilaceae bacterium]
MGSLIALDDSVLAVVDVQAGFLDRVEPERGGRFLERITWLVAVAARLEVPMLVTVENESAWGGVHASVAAELPAGVAVHDKRSFGLCDDRRVWEALVAVERKTVILCGMETEVCVAQSALGLLDRGLAPHVVLDAITSPRDGHELGLERMRGAGVPRVSAKGVFMEWVRTPEACRGFEAAHPQLFASDAPVLI